MAKTPKHCKILIEQYENTRKWCFEQIHILENVPEENRANWLVNTNKEYYIGMIYGVISMLEVALSKSKCYNGFSYIHEDGSFCISRRRSNRKLLRMEPFLWYQINQLSSALFR